MNVTYGPSTGALSGTETLQSCLESRLRARLEGTGSTMFQTTLKHWVTKSGRRIFAQRARAVRISGAGFGSWPTVRADDDNRSVEAYNRMLDSREGSRTTITSLQVASQLAAWPTPKASDGDGGRTTSTVGGGNVHLDKTARLSAWATPTTSPA